MRDPIASALRTAKGYGRRYAEGGSAGDPYTTELDPAETDDFAGWKQKYAPHDSGADYDLQGAYKAGMTPDPETGHFDDRFKKPNHPTFSTFSQYAKDRPDLAGTWQGDKYIPPQSNMVSDEDLSLAKINQQAAPREGGLMQTVPQFTGLVQTPEGRSKLAEGARRWFTGDTEGKETSWMPSATGNPFIKPIVEMVKGPGEAMAGNMTPTEQADWGAGTALGLTGMHMPFAESGTAGIFGGKLSATADKDALAKAKTMEKDGVNRDKIWEDTGWGKDASGEWMYHHDVSKAQINPLLPDHPINEGQVFIPEGKSVKLSNVFMDKDLYKAYPFLRDYTVVGHDELGQTNRLGLHMAKEKAIAVTPQSPESLFNTLVHEINHAVQTHEGFAEGGNEYMFLPKNFQQQALRLRKQESLLNDYLKKNDIPQKEAWDTVYKSIYQPAALTMGENNLVHDLLAAGKYPHMYDFMEKTNQHFQLRTQATDSYHRLAGEIASRNAEFRAKYNPEESRQTTPWASQQMMRQPVKPGDEILQPPRRGPQASLADARRSWEENPTAETYDDLLSAKTEDARASVAANRHMSPAEAIRWIKENTLTRDPERTWGYRDPQDYVRLAESVQAIRAAPTTADAIRINREHFEAQRARDEAARQDNPRDQEMERVQQKDQKIDPWDAATPAEAKEWIRNNTDVHDPHKHWGFKDPEDYVTLARHLNKEQERLSAPEPMPQPSVSSLMDRVNYTERAMHDARSIWERAHDSSTREETKAAWDDVQRAEDAYREATMALDLRRPAGADNPEARPGIRPSLRGILQGFRPDQISRMSRAQLSRVGSELDNYLKAHGGDFPDIIKQHPETWEALRSRFELFDRDDYHSDKAARFEYKPEDLNPDAGIMERKGYGHGDEVPAPPIGDRIRQVHDRFENKYNEHLALHFPNKDDFYHTFFGGMYRPGKIIGDWDNRKGFYFEGEISDPNGKTIGSINREFNPETKYAYHGYLKIYDEKNRGQGFIPNLLRNQISLYQKLGIDTVNMFANIDIGGYAWAKYGWLPDAHQWVDYGRRFKDDLQSGRITVPAGYNKDFLYRLFANKDPKSMWYLADLNLMEEQSQKPLGKALLIQKKYNANLHLNDPEVVRRFQDYVSSKLAKKQSND